MFRPNQATGKKCVNRLQCLTDTLSVTLENCLDCDISTMVVGGKLVFKGGATAGKKGVGKKRSRAEKPSNEKDKIQTEKSNEAIKKNEPKDEEELRPIVGTGRITSSGTALTGHATKFMSELHVGDAIMITHPTSFALETRLVRMVLSDTSIGISSAFSTDLVSTTSFQYVNAPPDEDAEDPEVVAKRQKLKEEDRAFGTYSSSGGTKVVYRVKKAGQYGGYDIVSAEASKHMTREDLLNVRSKKKADRYCY